MSSKANRIHCRAIKNRCPGRFHVMVMLAVVHAGISPACGQNPVHPAPSQQEMAAQRVLHAAPGTPKIDGQLDPVWETAPEAQTDRWVVDLLKLEPRQASTATFRCLWDAGHLYVLAVVKDDHVAFGNDAPWEQDSVEFLLDENLGRTKIYEDDDSQYRVNARGDLSYGGSTPKNIKAVVKAGPEGYLVEAAISFRVLNASAGSRIGFELQVNNDPGSGSRASAGKWSDVTDASWRDTSRFGVLMLSAADQVQPYRPQSGPLAESATPDVPGGPSGPIPVKERVPGWARDAIYYQIFPERFRNGDPTNDPNRESLEFPGIIPANWRVSTWTGDWYARSDWEQAMGDNFYEHGVFHRRYGGDLQGVIDRLDYLQTLGVNTLYFNPVFHARSLHKYDGNSFHHIDPHFGPDPAGDFALMAGETSDPKTWRWTKADRLFLELVRQAHARQLRVIIDGVFNHTGRDFWAFADIARQQRASPYLDWYTIESFDDPDTPQNEFKYACWWGVDTLPEFADNEDGTDLHPHPKAYVFDATRRWMDPDGDGDPADGIDGWRLDVANEVPNRFWQDWNRLVRQLNPDAFTVAEIWTDSGEYLSECGFSSTMNYFGFAYPTKGFLVDGRLPPSEFAAQITRRMASHPTEVQFALQNLMDSHDVDRLASSIVNASHRRPYQNPDRFDYDVGERVSPRHFPQYDVTRPSPQHRQIQRLVGLFQMTFVGAPMIYYGTEAGMDGADDPDDRMPMVWPDLDYQVRSMGPYGPLPRPQPVAFDQSMFEFYQTAFKLRARYPALRQGTFEILATDDRQQTLVFARTIPSETIVVVINRSEKPVTLRVPIPAAILPEGSRLKPVFSTIADPLKSMTVNQRHVQLELPPLAGGVWASH